MYVPPHIECCLRYPGRSESQPKTQNTPDANPYCLNFSSLGQRLKVFMLHISNGGLGNKIVCFLRAKEIGNSAYQPPGGHGYALFRANCWMNVILHPTLVDVTVNHIAPVLMQGIKKISLIYIVPVCYSHRFFSVQIELE